MNLILSNSEYVKYYTFIDQLFDQIPLFQDYLYFISDLKDIYCKDERLQRNNFFINGKELFEVASSNNTQFVWAVLSALKRKPEYPIKHPPYADENPCFWTRNPKPQIPDACFEIVCFDSSATLFIGVDDYLGNEIKIKYPDIKDLNTENKKKLSQS